MKAARGRAEALFFQGTRCLGEGDPAAAEQAFRTALSLVPEFPEALANLALALERQGRPGEAEDCYRRSLAQNDGQARVCCNLGALLARSGRFDEAEWAYLRAVSLAPADPSAWSNLGVLYASLKREDEAEQCYRMALANDENHASARFNLAYILLRQARFKEGWACLEARDWYGPLAAGLPFPRWQGEPLAGRSILLGCEAGHGDMIQFCRYVPLLKARGAARVGCLCHPALKRLFGSLPGLDEVRGLDETLPGAGWDWWVPPLSLPFLFDTREYSIPADIPYLRAEPGLAAAWAGRLPAAALRVGLAWRGNPRFENDAVRSLPGLSVLAPLWQVPGVSFVSLQKGEGEAEAAAAPPGMPLFNAGPDLADFADTAALVAGLDLVISVDTAVVHLAGALGKPGWVLLPDFQTDWRWLAVGSSSSWYPGKLRLFRQRVPGDWAGVIGEVAGALGRFRSLVTPPAPGEMPGSPPPARAG